MTRLMSGRDGEETEKKPSFLVATETELRRGRRGVRFRTNTTYCLLGKLPTINARNQCSARVSSDSGEWEGERERVDAIRSKQPGGVC